MTTRPGGRHDRRTEDPADRAGTDVVRRALDRARGSGARLIRLTLDPSARSSSAVLEALRGAVGTELDRVVTRRAGSSVLVDADVSAPPEPRAEAGPAEGPGDVLSDPATGLCVLLDHRRRPPTTPAPHRPAPR